MNLSDVSVGVLFLWVGIMTVTSAFFSGSETAMMALNRYRLRHLVNQKHRGARKANKLLRRPDRLLGVILIGNNFVNNMAATIATMIGLRLMGDTGVALAPILLTLLFLIFAEVSPKTIAAHAPERIAFPAAFVLQPLLKLLYPGVVMVNGVSNFLVRPFVGGRHAADDNLSMEELRTVVHEGARLPAHRQNMMLGVLDLGKVTVDDIMVPRSEIVGIDIDDDLSDILTTMASSQHTRLPMFRENINNIIGVLHLRRVSRFLGQDQVDKSQLMALTEAPYYIPEATPLNTQLVNFQKEKHRMALVVDEYGDIQGIATLEDILEEIVGEFTTDFAARIPEIHPQEDGSYVIDGTAVLREINRILGWNLPTDGPKTLNGLVLETLEFIPESNLCLQIGAFRMETLKIQGNVVKHIRVAVNGALDEDEGDAHD